MHNSKTARPGVTHATVPIDVLHPHPRNYRSHPERQVERLGRSIYALEMSADYCDVILRRWEVETGREAVLLERIS